MDDGRRTVPLLLETGAAYCGANLLVFAAKTFTPGLTAAAVAAAYFLFPVLFLSARKRDLARYGLQGFSLGKAAVAGLGTSMIVLPLFCAAYVSLHPIFPSFLPVVDAARVLENRGWAGILRIVGLSLFSNVFFVGVAEETFYRAYLQTNLSTAFPSRRRLRGVPVGWAVPLTALLFAAVHVAWWKHPAGMLVFFPGLLFGFLREWSGGIAAPALFHGMCNTTLFVLNGALFR